MRILYLCDFDLSRGTGKDRATLQKLQALEGKVDQLRVVSHTFGGAFFRLLSFFILDVKAMVMIMADRPNYLISRGYVGFFSQLVCGFLKVVTVREVHANALEELHLLPYQGLKLRLISRLALHSHHLDLSANIRIFNHPDLLAWYKNEGLAGPEDFFVYNGFDPSAKRNISKLEARERFNLKGEDKVIVFVGAASKWHGVEYVVELQKCFNEHGDNVVVAFGGGDISVFDPARVCINFSPLDEIGCADLIRAADFCVLPVKQNRVSPGSPLKLYDYIANERFVFAQSNTNGYSDEVVKFGVGKAVDFTYTEKARADIVHAFGLNWPESYPKCNASWSDRMGLWIEGIKRYPR